MKTVFKYIFTFLGLVLALFLSVKTVSAASSPSTPRSIRVIVSWQDGDKPALSEFKTFAMSGVPAPTPIVQNPVLTLKQVGNGSVTGKVGTDIKIQTNGDGQSPTYNSIVNEQVELEATQANGWTFSGWNNCVSTNNICTVTMDVTKEVTATFTDNSSTNRQLTLSQTGSGTGSVSDADGIITNAANPSTIKTYSNNKAVTLTANPSNSTVVWSGPDAGSCSGATCSLIMSGPKNITATFTQITHDLTVNRAGAGAGSVTGPNSINLTSNGQIVKTFAQGETVTLTANPSNSTVAWSGCDTSNGNTCNITMSYDKNVTATFTPVAPSTYTLTIKQINHGTGTGIVTGQVTVAGVIYSINSTSTTDVSSVFPANSVVPLVATATAPSHFDSMTGAGCAGANCSVTMNADKTVTAEFGETTCDGVFVYIDTNYNINSKNRCYEFGDYNSNKLGIYSQKIRSILVPKDHSVVISRSSCLQTGSDTFNSDLITSSIADVLNDYYSVESMKVCNQITCALTPNTKQCP